MSLENILIDKNRKLRYSSSIMLVRFLKKENIIEDETKTRLLLEFVYRQKLCATRLTGLSSD